MLKKLFHKHKQVEPQRQDLMTDSGMFGVWNYQSFSHIVDYDTWDPELCEDEDILKQISGGKFVPIDLGDGVASVDVRIDSPNTMNSREKEYLLVPSKPYKLRTSGKVCVSGIEYIGKDPSATQTLTFDVEAGEYTVYVNLIDWNQEPEAMDAEGNPTENALPDVIVFITKEKPKEVFRCDLETFRKEDALR